MEQLKINDNGSIGRISVPSNTTRRSGLAVKVFALGLLLVLNLYAGVNLQVGQYTSIDLSGGQVQKIMNTYSRRSLSREITITNYGWFDLDPQVGIKLPRCLAAKDFNDAIVAHERYNANAWHDLEQNPDPNRPIIAFMDIDTCNLIHWPKFGGDFVTNSDLEGGRPPHEGFLF